MAEFAVVNLDEYTDFAEVATKYAAILFERPMNETPVPCASLDEVAHQLILSDEEHEQLHDCLSRLPNFWERHLTLRARPTTKPLTIWRVFRFRTDGDPVLIQTARWVQERLGIRSPIVWLDEEPHTSGTSSAPPTGPS